MSKIVVKGPYALTAVEAALAEVDRMAAARETADLELPMRLHGRQFGGTASAIQLAATWAKQNPTGRLLLFPNTRLPQAIVNDHTCAATLLAHDVCDSEGNSVRVAAMQLASKRLQSMGWEAEPQLELLGTESVGDKRGGKYLLMAVEGVPHLSGFGAPKAIYATDHPGDANLRTLGEFEHIASRLLIDMVEASGAEAARFSAPVQERLGAILHELVKNTEAWARDDVTGPVRPSLRGYRSEAHVNDGDYQRSVVRDAPPLDRYLEHPVLKDQRGRLRFVELSVFDNGPGITHRLLHGAGITAPSADEEYDALVECLRWRYTSDPHHHGGIGLDLVLGMLTELGGFLRIRTGRLSVFRDFVVDPYSDGGSAVGLRRWPSIHNLRPAPTAGSVLTMLFPVRHE